MSINLKEVIGIGGELFYYLPALFLIKVAVVIALGLGFRLGLRASVLAVLLLATFDAFASVIFCVAYISFLMNECALALAVTRSQFLLMVLHLHLIRRY